mmetsp:Transcript_6800/g.18265  ORF Transcript_6800/g.18265 Transcript_6800/m.18265 type:complete len:221 (-) Transcript_6800:221-883(-)
MSRACMSSTRSKSDISMCARTPRMAPSLCSEASTRAKAETTPASTARCFALESVSMMLCRAPMACAIKGPSWHLFISCTTTSTAFASRRTRLLLVSAARFISSCRALLVLPWFKSQRLRNLTMGGAPPSSTICFRPSGTSASATSALMAPPAKGVAGPSFRMASSSFKIGDRMTSTGCALASFLTLSHAPRASMLVFTFNKEVISLTSSTVNGRSIRCKS